MLRRSLRLLLWIALLGVALWFRSRNSPPQPEGDGNESQESIGSRVRQFGVLADARWCPYFEKAGVAYPPARVVLVGLKQERVLEVYAGKAGEGALRFIRSYPVLAASGGPGPKQKEGDRQVPEGLYTIEYLNPNSDYHLSMKVSYPNAFDRARAAEEGRANLGGDIMIHGRDVSVGCLAMGDDAAEDLFILAARTGIEKIEVILAPVDFRERRLSTEAMGTLPTWTATLYPEIETALRALPAKPLSNSNSSSK